MAKNKIITRIFWEDERRYYFRTVWVFAGIAAAAFTVVASICAAVFGVSAHSCSSIGDQIGRPSSYEWSRGCYVQTPDGKWIPEARWWGYEEPSKSDVNVEIGAD